MSSYASSDIMNASFSTAISAISSSCFLVSTAPVGLFGVFITMHLGLFLSVFLCSFSNLRQYSSPQSNFSANGFPPASIIDGA